MEELVDRVTLYCVVPMHVRLKPITSTQYVVLLYERLCVELCPLVYITLYLQLYRRTNVIGQCNLFVIIAENGTMQWTGSVRDL